MKNNKERTAVWLYPETMERLDGWLRTTAKAAANLLKRHLALHGIPWNRGYLLLSFQGIACLDTRHIAKLKTGWQIIYSGFRWKSA